MKLNSINGFLFFLVANTVQISENFIPDLKLLTGLHKE